MKWLAFMVSIFLSVIPSLAISEDWDSCADDLDRLRRAARDAADAAEDVKSKADDYENCKRYPDIYDLMEDQCRSKAYDYRSALSTLESELDTVDNRIRSVNSSCGIELTNSGASLTKPKTPSSGNRICDLYRSYKNKLPLETLIKSCMQSMSEAECRRCLAQ